MGERERDRGLFLFFVCKIILTVTTWLEGRNILQNKEQEEGNIRKRTINITRKMASRSEFEGQATVGRNIT